MGLDMKASNRSPMFRIAQDPHESLGGIGILRNFPMPTQVITDHLTVDWGQTNSQSFMG